MAKLMGFTVIETQPAKPLSLYTNNATQFNLHVHDHSSTLTEDLMRDGMFSCINMAERILSFLVKFYHSIPFYSNNNEGIDPERKIDIEEICTRINGYGFGKLIGEFKRLGDNNDVNRILERVVNRPSIWEEGTESDQFEFLNNANAWRKEHAHRLPPNAREFIKDFMSSYLNWLDWLAGDPHGGSYCIYPVILNLRLVTTNRCGVTTIKYAFQKSTPTSHYTSISEDETKLYTNQDLRAEYSYYGIPHSHKTQPDIWVDPMLISTGIFDC
jgi:hypothetical protein